ncbi:MAG: GNAT family N-acetyltransferase [Pseudomonadota bacterium]|nr:GNAT family N-acetyltransferase [Pseudomonadota bacterium]
MAQALPSIEVRQARREDADDIAAMARALSVSDGGRESRFSAEAVLRDGFGDNPAFETMVATVGGVTVGYAVYYWGYDTDSATRGVYLADLYVDRHYRRSGAGTALVGSVARESREGGARWIFWSVLKGNRAARRFYRHIAPELKDVLVCAAFGASFDKIANAGE